MFGRDVMIRHRQMAGASLIEVLVAIVISSVGLLALAGVNGAALRYAKLSQFRATATLLANDMGERMRANRAGVLAGSYTYTETHANQQTSTIAAPSQLCNLSSSTCSAGEIAAVDLYQWRSAVAAALPQGAVNLSYNSAQVAADIYVVWKDAQVDADDERPAIARECPDALSRGGDLSIRCLFFRVNI